LKIKGRLEMDKQEPETAKCADQCMSRFDTMRAGALLGVASLAGLFPVTPGFAQTASDAAEDENIIIVTAQRRAEALEDVPMTVSVVTNDVMEAAGVNSMRDLTNVTTGFQIAQGGTFPQPAIRGVSTLLNGTFENNVAVYVDGFYQPAAQQIAIDLPNVESVQVLKGPQGTLYGRNATGGAILVNTISPGDSWEGKYELTYGRFNDMRVSGYTAGPLTEGIGVSLAGYLRRSDGYTKLTSRTVPGETAGDAAPIDQDSFRAKVTINLSENFRATVGYNFVHISDPRADLLTPYENVMPVQAPAEPTRPKKFSLGLAAYDIDSVVESRQHEGTLKLELDTGIGTLTSYSGYGQFTARNSFDFDGTYLDGVWSTSLIRERYFQQAFDYSINAIENLDLIVGATYFHDKLKFIEPSDFYTGSSRNPGTVEVPLSNYTLLFRSFFDQKKEAWAVYADATYHLSDALSINLGGRYSKETQNVAGEQTSILPILRRAPNSARASFSKFTPRASIRYEIAPRTNIYATFSQGFRSGAFVSQLPAIPTDWIPAEQETVTAYEVGFKTAQGRFRFEAAGFYYDYKDFQVSATLAGPSGNPVTLITNAPSAEIYGAEASFEVMPIDNLTIRAGATWLHARYGDNFLFGSVGVNPALPAINTHPNPLKTYQNVNQTQDLSGLQMSRAPNLTANLGIDYFIPNGEGGLRFGANVKYTDSYVVTNPGVWGPLVASEFQRKQRFREGKYALVNASVTWTDPTGHIYGRIWGNNLTDHRYRIHYTGNNSWGTYSPMAEPRTYGVTLGYKFGR
jgi:iron complex outermembrane recepter protein